MHTKKILKAENGDELVYINLSYPVFDNGELKKHANAFYEKLAENFLLFATKNLIPKAADAKRNVGFKPFSAVMMYDSEENDNNVKVTVRTFVFDGQIKAEGKNVFQCWDKRTGLMSIK